MELKVVNASCGYGKKTIISNISMKIKSGEIMCLLGPNGVGKTTLFKTILGLLELQSGDILLDGKNVKKWSKKDFAKVIGYVPQAHTPPFPFTVLEVVLMGRTPYLGACASPTKKDTAVAEENLDLLGIAYLKDKVYTDISGGERQMVLIARALTQQPKILFMDEPTSNLDYGNQVRVLERIVALAKTGLGVIMTSHSPDHAFLCSTKVALLQRNGLFEIGAAHEIVTENNLRSTYGVDIMVASVTGKNGNSIKTCIPMLS
ncbi:iron ABC transporter, ATP-binding protein [Methanosarcina siciliae HI350]|uniref:Cobalamin import ATP-binding protein BtuD n=1 Tax=Methanosarcina siciliae HI350 TaxID=1434119 RepID=A0A0E3PGS3_9EURY|nr:ABC transporter ATP-binding protein [Methanosarcina siciliae]AKB33567.1 iron ABC transporter, ATP-binding protein [Methanosarcina siciliae HI350]